VQLILVPTGSLTAGRLTRCASASAQRNHLPMIGPLASQGLRTLRFGEREGFFFSY
jgi:hypothetical protein